MTRCPLHMVLRNIDGGANYKTLVEFEFGAGGDYKRFEDPREEEIRREITERTNKLAGTDNDITDEPIKMMITSSDLPDLELIDLPGFTRNAVGKSSLGRRKSAYPEQIIPSPRPTR